MSGMVLVHLAILAKSRCSSSLVPGDQWHDRPNQIYCGRATMKHLLKAGLMSFIMALGIALPAIAAQLEDGVDAYVFDLSTTVYCDHICRRRLYTEQEASDFLIGRRYYYVSSFAQTSYSTAAASLAAPNDSACLLPVDAVPAGRARTTRQGVPDRERLTMA